MASPTATYSVRARNSATQSENRIHADDVARDYGFRGGLVPGVTVYAYMARPVAATWGLDWVRNGSMSARFAQPVYDGEDATVEFNTEDGALAARNPAGEVCATGAVSLAPIGLLPSVDDYPEMPLPSSRPPASDVSLAKGTVLGSVGAGFHADRAEEYLDRIVDDDLPLWRDERVAHPGYILLSANGILTANVKLGPWIHVGSECTHFGVVADGDRWSTRGHVADLYERKGHKFVELDLLVVANGEEPVMAIRHTAIYEPAARR